MCEIGSKLTIKTPEGRQWRCSGISIVNFQQILLIARCLYCWLWTSKCRLDKNIVKVNNKKTRLKYEICSKLSQQNWWLNGLIYCYNLFISDFVQVRNLDLRISTMIKYFIFFPNCRDPNQNIFFIHHSSNNIPWVVSWAELENSEMCKNIINVGRRWNIFFRQLSNPLTTSSVTSVKFPFNHWISWGSWMFPFNAEYLVGVTKAKHNGWYNLK